MGWYPFLLDCFPKSVVLGPSLSSRSRNISPFQLRSRLATASALARSLLIPYIQQAADNPEPTALLQNPARPPPTTPSLSSPPSAPAPESSFLFRTPPFPYLCITTSSSPNLGPSSQSQAAENASIDLRHAYQGLSLLQTSLQSLPRDPAFARQLYAHALVYLLQGLPPHHHLSEHEIASLREARPVYLRGGGEYGTAEQQQQDPATPSLLHRVLETLVFFLIIALRILAPCIRALISTVAVYDRQYGIKERAAELSTAVARKTWAWTAENVDARYLVSLSAEITGGIEEGWRKGSGHVRVRKSTQ